MIFVDSTNSTRCRVTEEGPEGGQRLRSSPSGYPGHSYLQKESLLLVRFIIVF